MKVLTKMKIAYFGSFAMNKSWRRLASFSQVRLWTFLGIASLALSGCLSAFSVDEPSAQNTNILPEAARSAEQSGQFAVAANYYRKMYLEGAEGLPIILGYARNLRYAGAVSDAVAALEDVEDAYEDAPDFLLEIGKARLAAGRGDAAVLTLLRAAKLDAKNWEVHSALGIGYDLLKEYDNAANAYRRALSLSPENSTVLNNKAMSLAQNGKIDAAIKVLESVPNLRQGKAHIRQNLALFYGIKGNFKKAESYTKLDLDDEMVKHNMAYFRRFQAKRVSK